MTIYLIVGGAGSLGRRLTAELLKPEYDVTAIRVLDNHENSLVNMEIRLKDSRLRFFAGDIRDKGRLIRAMENVNICINCAALKHVHVCQTSPFESILTNVLGVQNCIDAALQCNIDKFLQISSDKAVQAINTYGRCKALSESLTLDANNYKGDRKTLFSVARPPNFLESDGSCFDVWNYQKSKGKPLTVTDKEATRYFLSFDEIISFIFSCLRKMKGGEIFVPCRARKLKIIDLAKQISDKIEITGLRRGEKLNELLMDPGEFERAKLIEGMWVINES